MNVVTLPLGQLHQSAHLLVTQHHMIHIIQRRDVLRSASEPT